MNTRKSHDRLLIISIIAIAGLIFLLIYTPEPKNLTVVKGIVEAIETDSKTNDVAIKLKEEKGTYYINQGADDDILMNNLKLIVDNQVIISYPKRKSLLGISGAFRAVDNIIAQGEIIYSN